MEERKEGDKVEEEEEEEVEEEEEEEEEEGSSLASARGIAHRETWRISRSLRMCDEWDVLQYRMSPKRIVK